MPVVSHFAISVDSGSAVAPLVWTSRPSTAIFGLSAYAGDAWTKAAASTNPETRGQSRRGAIPSSYTGPRVARSSCHLGVARYIRPRDRGHAHGLRGCACVTNCRYQSMRTTAPDVVGVH